MASINDVIANLTVVRESLTRASAAAAHAAGLAREVQDQLAAMGAYGVAERLTPGLDTIEEVMARLARRYRLDRRGDHPCPSGEGRRLLGWSR